MAARLIDDTNNVEFVDDSGVQCFIDDLGNFTCEGPTSLPRGHKGGKHQIVISDGWHFVR